MKPQSGTWIGIFLIPGGQASQVLVELEVNDDDHSIAGRITTIEATSSRDAGPVDRILRSSRYSPFGSIHLEYYSDDSNTAVFDGRFNSPDRHTGVIWATGTFRQDGRAGAGLLALLHSNDLETVYGKGPWGK